MKILKVALVLLVLASFLGSATVVSMAAMATPTMKPMATTAKPTMAAVPKVTAKPNATMGMPAVPAATKKAPAVPSATIKTPTTKGMAINLDQMKSTIGSVYKMLKNTTKMPGKKKSVAGLGVQNKASQIVGDTYGNIAAGAGKPLQSGMSAIQPISQLNGLPTI